MQLVTIQSRIHEIRGQKIMLDYDLAELYDVETKSLNLSVKRNIQRFPEDFMFQLTKEEWEALRFQFETSNERGGNRYLPYAFTEQGLAMLSGILRSDKAIEVNIFIMRAFVTLRQFVLTNKELSDKLIQLEYKFKTKFNDIDAVLDHLLGKKDNNTTDNRKKIGYKK